MQDPFAELCEFEDCSQDETTTKIEFFGGVGKIGGNKIVLVGANQKALLLDFGWDFSINHDFLHTFMALRKYQILKDSFILQEMPIPKGYFAGIYREDLYTYSYPELREKYQIVPGQPTYITDVLVSHAHADHIGDLQYLHPSIRIICSEITKAVFDHLEKMASYNAMMKNILKFKPFYQQQYTQKGGINRTKNGIEIERCLSSLINGAKVLCAEGGFEVTLYETDHSIPGASAFLIRDTNNNHKIVYTGDIRMHGPLKEQTYAFIEAAAKFQPDTLVIEGTRLYCEKPKDGDTDTKHEERDELDSEQVVEDKITKILIDIKKEDPNRMVFYECAPRDVWRFRSLYHAAKKADRILVVYARNYDLIERCVRQNLLSDVNLSEILVYLPKKGWGQYDEKDYSNSVESRDAFMIKEKDPNKVVAAEDIHKNPSKYMFYLPFFSMLELNDIDPPENSYYIISKSEPFDDEGWIEHRKRKNWLNCVEIPENHVFQVHCSGHARKKELEEIVTRIHPKKLFPIHTQCPEEFLKMNIPKDIEIIIPQKGVTYSL
jgi:ribonuclease J